jgi:hypothetical protein
MSPRICYVPRNFSSESLYVIDEANEICENYRQQGYDLTLRQLFYQFVSRDLLPNSERSYKRLGSIVNDARLAGLLDWRYIVDRTRNVRVQPHWNDPSEIILSAAQGFAMDKWQDQATHVEVWIEKDALVGVLQACCPVEDVPYFSCRGYTSQSEIWGAAQRLGGYIKKGKRIVVIHLGDHDPSGIDMTRDIEERLDLFIAHDLGMADKLKIERIALNADQIEAYRPPPNPAKLTDSRASGYIGRFGRSSWELDALEPAVLVKLIGDAISRHRDLERWEKAVKKQETEREVLTAASERWPEIKEYLNEQD